MIKIPSWLHRAPAIAYGLAAAIFVFSFWIEYHEMWMEYRFAGVESEKLNALRARIVFHAFREAVYVGLTGVSFEILLAIYAKISPRALPEAAE